MKSEDLKTALGGLTETTERENGTVQVLHITDAGSEYRVEDADENKALMTLATYLKKFPVDDAPAAIPAPPTPTGSFVPASEPDPSAT